MAMVQLPARKGSMEITLEAKADRMSDSDSSHKSSLASSIKAAEEEKAPVVKRVTAIEPATKKLDPAQSLLHWLSVYRKMFAFIFFSNLLVLIIFVAKHGGYPTLTNVKDATSANILACVMMRQENWVNFCYEVMTSAPLWTPMFIRKQLAKVYHYGGVHSGCGTAAVAWFLLYTVLTTKEYIEKPEAGLPVANVVVTYGLIVMYLTILAGAHPKFRVRYHDYFEVMHRFAGWTSFLILWTQTAILSFINAKKENTTPALVLLRNPGFWFVSISTCFLFLSWGRLRLRKVRAEVLSNHCTRLHFDYRHMKPLYGLKVSDRPVTEWHAFATIPAPAGQKGFSIIVSNAGDWTKKAITNPPTHLWTRGAPVHGPLYGARLFRSIVLVATGSGIGPCMSLLVDDKVPRRVFWSTRTPQTTYGQGVVDEVMKSDPKAVIWDTTKRGYPDIVEEVYKLYLESGAEAVYIVSNPKVMATLTAGMKKVGVPCYGPIFDS